MSSRLQGKEAQRLGSDNEIAVACSFDRHKDQWIDVVEHATQDEDSQGIDCWVRTCVGDIPLQVKSGIRKARLHTKRYPDIPVVVVFPGDSEKEIRRKVRACCRKWLKERGIEFDRSGKPCTKS